MHDRGKNNFSNKCCWRNWKATCKRIKLNDFLIPHMKRNPRWVKDLNVIPETIKLLEENIGTTVLNIEPSNIFLDVSIGKCNKSKNILLNYTKIKSFCTRTTTKNHQQHKIQSTEWKKIFANDILDIGLIYKIYIYTTQHQKNIF